MSGESSKPTRFAVHCPRHGLVYLTTDEYLTQLDRPDSKWACPRYDIGPELVDIGLCGRTSEFDDSIYEAEFD